MWRHPEENGKGIIFLGVLVRLFPFCSGSMALVLALTHHLGNNHKLQHQLRLYQHHISVEPPAPTHESAPNQRQARDAPPEVRTCLHLCVRRKQEAEGH